MKLSNTPGVEELVVIDNAIQKEEFDKIKNIILSNEFDWHLIKNFVDNEENDIVLCDKFDNYKFIHMMYSNQKSYNEKHNYIWSSILKILNVKDLIRIKVNLTMNTNKIVKHGWHCDAYPSDDYPQLRSAIYYLNTCDGYTEFKHNNKKIYSKENRLIVFPNHFIHTGTTTTNELARYVVNFNFY